MIDAAPGRRRGGRHHRRRRPVRGRLPVRLHARLRPRHLRAARRARGGRGDLAPRRAPGDRRSPTLAGAAARSDGAAPAVPHRRSRARRSASPSSSTRGRRPARTPTSCSSSIVSAVRLARDRADRGDLKIANAALKEMRYAFHVFEPYRDGAQGRDLRLGAHRSPTTRSTTRRVALAAAIADARLDGDHRRRARDHGGRDRGRRARRTRSA